MALLIAVPSTISVSNSVRSKPSEVFDRCHDATGSEQRIHCAIFDCYKSLVKHFKKYGFMKKVYETAREFEAAVRSAFNMVPADQLDDFCPSLKRLDTPSTPSMRRTETEPSDPWCHHQLVDDGTRRRIGGQACGRSSIYDNLTKAGELSQQTFRPPSRHR